MILHWARYVPSPNASSRDGEEVDSVVIHHISLPPGRFGGPDVEDFFCNRLDCGRDPFYPEISNLRVSAHFFVDRAGQVTQFVDTDLKAWHAGESSLGGRPDVNRFSVGIELEGDEVSPYTDAQYETLLRVLNEVKQHHPLVEPSRVVGHEHVAPGRKRDPGPLFDWERVQRDLRAWVV